RWRAFPGFFQTESMLQCEPEYEKLATKNDRISLEHRFTLETPRNLNVAPSQFSETAQLPPWKPCPIGRPTKASHGLLNHVQRLSVPLIQIMTGAWSAMSRKRSSLCTRASSARLRALMSSVKITMPPIVPSACIHGRTSHRRH